MTSDEKLLQAEISPGSMLAALPRWILRSKTKFAAFLARTFHIKRCGNSSASAVFPIPAPFCGLFDVQGSPKLGARRWSRLCHRRALHVVVMALNYIHNDMSPVPSALLGRRPSHAHLAIYGRLRSLLTACDRPGSFPLPPGRSGFEFIARLIELEHFAGSHEAFCPDLYTGASEKVPRPVSKCGDIGPEHAFQSAEQFSPVQPYRSLVVDRLKLTGTGKWNMADYIDDVLWLPFVEPAILAHGSQKVLDGPDFSRESEDDNLALAKLWDSKGLLALFDQPHRSGLACRVFNAHKNASTDRQIGDRRWLNSSERHLPGPSKFLLAGPNIASMHCPLNCRLLGSASDRKDFYHQSCVSRERASSNQLPFSFDEDCFAGSRALSDLHEELGKPQTRDDFGDRYKQQRRSVLVPEHGGKVWAGFKSLFQGDHLGVEFALSSHTELLKQGGLLDEASTVLRHRPYPRGPLWQGLVIDDYFVVSREPVNGAVESSASVRCLDAAEQIYERAGVFGSPEKTVRGAENFTVIGAEVFSDSKARSAGVITVSAPGAKRVPMIALSLKVASLPIISRALASRLAGNWISIFMYRRACSCVLSNIFNLGSKTSDDANEVVRLDRSTAEELVLASVLGLVAIADISVPYSSKLYATDASMSKGAITEKDISPTLAEVLWLGGDRKGAYTMLDNPARQQLRWLGCDVDEEPVAEDFEGPCKSLRFVFDAVEICGGSGILSEAMCAQGLVVCPPIDLSDSKHYDLRNVKLVNWILQMLHEERFKSIVCEPVCTTFSPAQHPASRSYEQPLGFQRDHPKTLLGNIIAFRCLTILWFAWRCSIPSLLEQPQLSKMAWLPFWRYLLQLGFAEAIINSCAFGSIHKKPFRWLGWGVDVDSMNVRCPGGHQHVRIEGRYTKASAVYHPKLAEFVASKIKEAVIKFSSGDVGGKRVELESVVLNDLLQQDFWKVCGDWQWKRPAHINVLESRSLVALFRQLVLGGGDQRFSVLLDSRVAKGAHGKGRSSARALRPSLLRGCAYTVAGGLYPAYGFAPTRLNTADAPTREKHLPLPSDHSILDFLSEKQISCLHSRQFSRAAAGWVRLYILVAFCLCPGESANIDSAHHTFGFLTLQFSIPLLIIGLGILACLLPKPPPFWTHQCVTRGSHGLRTLWPRRFFSLLVLVSWICCSSAMPLAPTGTDEANRAARRAGNILQADRVVLQQTRDRRENLLLAFDVWLGANLRTTLERLLEPSCLDCDAVAEALVSYGKDMYQAGKSYGRFSETINAVTAKRPMLRRRVAIAWDLAFNWVVDEPHEHHTALPLSVMLACVTLSLLWGWTREAAVIALAWTGVLRVHEVLQATRRDLVLPEDAAPGHISALLMIRSPKTRGRAARHQSTRIDPTDVVQLLSAVYKKAIPSEPLWPLSPATLRKRFSCLLAALGIAPREDGSYIYSLSSLRPGGATYWLAATEDAEFVRRKGRWLSTRVLEIYLQETSVATYQRNLSEETKSRINDLCRSFSRVLSKAIFLKESRVPENAWPQLW